MQLCYECQICKYIVKDAPPEWCPMCGGHRIIFKRLSLLAEEIELERI